MKRSLLPLAGGLALALPLLAAPAQADPSPAPSSTRQADDAAQQRRVLAFWTPARMRSATPMEKLFKPRPVAPAEVRRGLAQVAPPVQVQSIPNGGSAWTGGGQVVRTAGRVFFTYQNRTASCSGDAVTSANKSTVVTAGHCVKLEGAWHTNWVFVPGYNNGSTPYGTWTAAKTLATPQWGATEDLNYDVGAAVVNQLNGQRLTDVVGGQGIAFNQARGQNMYAFGYPAAAPYDGSKLIYCSGRVVNDFLGSQDLGLRCNMTGGSSGGPWFLNFNEGTGAGVQNSVNSFKYNLPILNAYMFGPYFGADAQNLYNQAQNS
ncbi:trypsin-like serine peptidase [Actinomadura hibisca]|uniref:trypsin-like serine peptidase n=1 Tax=Actinomadura hibisca TaxID=68565 RepID=UPI00083461C3|nr:peptidase [Actinomadura hibisca]